MLGLGLGLTNTATLNKGGGWSPLSLGSKCVAWWTADRADLVTLSGSFVTSWRDVVGGYDAVQAVNAARPAYSATGFGGRPCVIADGVDDELTCTSSGLLSALPTGATPGEIWAVAQQSALAADTTARILAGYGGAASTSRRAVERAVSSGVNRGRITTGDGATVVTSVGNVVNFSSRHVVAGIVAATSHQVSVDNSTPATASVTPSTQASRVRMFSISNTSAGNYWNGSARDVIFISGGMTDIERSNLMTWALARRMV